MRPSAQSRTRRSRQDAVSPRRRQLLQIAASRCAELGVENLTVEQITSRAGVSRATFYQHFASVDEIFLTLVEETAHVLAEAQTIPDGNTDDHRAVIRETTTAYARAVFASNGLVAAIDHSTYDDGSVAIVWLRARTRTRERYARYLQHLEDVGKISACADLERIVGTLSDALICGAPRVGAGRAEQNRFIKEHIAITERLLGIDQ